MSKEAPLICALNEKPRSTALNIDYCASANRLKSDIIFSVCLRNMPGMKNARSPNKAGIKNREAMSAIIGGRDVCFNDSFTIWSEYHQMLYIIALNKRETPPVIQRYTFNNFQARFTARRAYAAGKTKLFHEKRKPAHKPQDKHQGGDHL